MTGIGGGPDPRPIPADPDRVDPAHDLGLDPDLTDPRPLLVPFPADEMAAGPVGTLVNDPGNDVAGCLERAG